MAIVIAIYCLLCGLVNTFVLFPALIYKFIKSKRKEVTNNEL